MQADIRTERPGRCGRHTTGFEQGDLKHILSDYFALARPSTLSVIVTSFSFRDGLFKEADLIFDVRFLVNPYYNHMS